VFISKKLRCSFDSELAYGAVTEAGNAYLDLEFLARLVMKPWEHERELAFERKEVQWRKGLYRGARELPAVEGRRLILVDDGIATGATFIAAIQGLRKLKPARLVAAVPAAPTDTLGTLAPMVDELHVLERCDDFIAVGACYESFPEVHDWEVVARLSVGHARRVQNVKLPF
jgi:putative phosphoribosyl transferase